MWDLSSLIRDRNCVLCTARWVLKHWAIGGVSISYLKTEFRACPIEMNRSSYAWWLDFFFIRSLHAGWSTAPEPAAPGEPQASGLTCLQRVPPVFDLHSCALLPLTVSVSVHVSCKKHRPEGFCIPEEFQNQLMAVVVGERELGVVLSRVFWFRGGMPQQCV